MTLVFLRKKRNDLDMKLRPACKQGGGRQGGDLTVSLSPPVMIYRRRAKTMENLRFYVEST